MFALEDIAEDSDLSRGTLLHVARETVLDGNLTYRHRLSTIERKLVDEALARIERYEEQRAA